MFGTSDPDLRALSDEGKIWYDELARMMGSDTKGRAEAFVKEGGKADLRDFDVMTRSGGYPASRQQGKGPGSGGYPAQGPSSVRLADEGDEEGAQGPGTDKAAGTSKARRTGYAPQAASWYDTSS